jgi:hypothetical protein
VYQIAEPQARLMRGRRVKIQIANTKNEKCDITGVHRYFVVMIDFMCHLDWVLRYLFELYSGCICDCSLDGITFEVVVC